MRPAAVAVGMWKSRAFALGAISKRGGNRGKVREYRGYPPGPRWTFPRFPRRVISTATPGAGLLLPLLLPEGKQTRAGRWSRISRSRGFHGAAVTTSAGAETRQATGWRVPTMVLSETRGLQLYGVIRGGLEYPLRLARRGEAGPNGLQETHPRTRASVESTDLDRREDLPIGRLRPGAQAACAFRCSASKRPPFFQTVKVMVAILRARVRSASSGFMPWASLLA